MNKFRALWLIGIVVTGFLGVIHWYLLVSILFMLGHIYVKRRFYKGIVSESYKWGKTWGTKKK